MTASTIDILHSRFHGLLEHTYFKTVVGTLIYLNPVALAWQVWSVFAAPSVEGIALPMMIIFSFIQSAMIFEGIRVRSAPVFWSMFISVIETLTIILVVLVRG